MDGHTAGQDHKGATPQNQPNAANARVAAESATLRLRAKPHGNARK